MLSAMNFASSVAVAVALGTPGIGNVTTGLLPSHATDVLPTVMTSAGTRCGLGVIGGGSEVPANAALNAPCGLAHKRIIRSSTVAGIGVAFPLPATSSAPGISSFQAYALLRTSTLEQLWPLGRVPVIRIRSPDVW